MHPTACDAIADIVQNAFEAGAAHVELTVERKGHILNVTVADDGRGMDAATLARATDPFWTEPGKHPGRKVGLGLPFVKDAADLSGGAFRIESAPGQGTTVAFSFDLSSIDAPPLGDATATFTSLVAYPGDHDLRITRIEDDLSYDVSSSGFRDALGDLQNASSLGLVRDFFAANEEEIRSAAPAPLSQSNDRPTNP